MRKFKECSDCANYIEQFFGCHDCKKGSKAMVIKTGKHWEINPDLFEDDVNDSEDESFGNRPIEDLSEER
jgi:hypothetical protein